MKIQYVANARLVWIDESKDEKVTTRAVLRVGQATLYSREPDSEHDCNTINEQFAGLREMLNDIDRAIDSASRLNRIGLPKELKAKE
jgi:hypothetical protein